MVRVVHHGGHLPLPLRVRLALREAAFRNALGYSRQPDRKGRSPTRLAFHGDGAPLRLGEFLGQCQTDAGSLMPPPGRGIRLPEAVKNVGQLLLADPDPGVAHLE